MRRGPFDCVPTRPAALAIERLIAQLSEPRHDSGLDAFHVLDEPLVVGIVEDRSDGLDTSGTDVRIVSDSEVFDDEVAGFGVLDTVEAQAGEPVVDRTGVS